MKKLNIAILGFGTIGSGTYHILKENKEIIANRAGVEVEVVKILNRSKKANIEDYLYTDNPDDIINDPNINLVVETIGGIEPATSFMLSALKNGKHVVTANKAAVAANYPLLIKTAKDNNVKFLFEASVGGGIPVLTSIENALQGNNFLEVMGIVNGTTNYILTKMTEEGANYAEVLKDAQEKGFAEADPTADVEGIDAANKLSILIALLFNQYIHPDQIATTGISKITLDDIKKADENNSKIKLIAHAKYEDGKLSASVGPKMIDKSHPLSGVNNEFNAIFIKGDMVDEVMFYGRGAGSLPTGSAVVGDIIAIAKSI